VISAEEEPDTVFVLSEKLACFLPPGTVTLAGAETADVLLDEMSTTTPSEGALALRVTVPSDDEPAATVAGLRLTDETESTLPLV
jgi:hypothetical protein